MSLKQFSQGGRLIPFSPGRDIGKGIVTVTMAGITSGLNSV
jgi:hypothetical protein